MGTIKTDYITGITGTENSGPLTFIGDTVTLPAAGVTGTLGSGVVIPAAGVTGTLGSGVAFPAGHVVAVYHDIDTEPQTYGVTAHTWTDSNLSITFTPKSVNSKFVIQGQWSERGVSAGSAMKIVRVGATEPSTGSTLIGDTSSNRPRATVRFSYQSQDSNHTIPISYCVYDDPDTASEITYKLQFMVEGATTYINRTEGYIVEPYSYAAIDVSNMIILEFSS